MPVFDWNTTDPYELQNMITSEFHTEYGDDITTWQSYSQTEPDLDPTFTIISGKSKDCVVQACARRLCMRHGSHAESPDDGYDLRKAINTKWSTARAFSIKTAIERECMKDDRVYLATAKVEYNPTTRTCTFYIELTTIVGVFDLVMNVDTVSVTVLRAG